MPEKRPKKKILTTSRGGSVEIMISIQKAIIFSLVILLVGVSLGFGFRSQIGSALNLEAQKPSEFWLPDYESLGLIRGDNGCVPPKYWTGNGCADTSKWTIGDWYFFTKCIEKLNPVTDAGIYNCVRQTEIGKGRK